MTSLARTNVTRCFAWPACALLVAAFAGCASEPPLSRDVVNGLKTHGTVVLFSDDWGAYRKKGGRYNMPGPTIETIPYKAVWAAGKELSQFHAERMAKLGFKARSAYDFLSDDQIAKLTSERQQGAPVLTSALCDALKAQDQDYLIWITWSGLSWFPVIIGAKYEQIYTDYYVFDLRTRKFLWNGDLSSTRPIGYELRFGHAFSEIDDYLNRDNFAGLKKEVFFNYEEQYRPGEDSVGWLFGLAGQITPKR